MSKVGGMAHSDRIEAEWEARLRVLAQMREPFEDVSLEEIEREVEKEIAEVRREKGSLPGGNLSKLRSGGM